MVEALATASLALALAGVATLAVLLWRRTVLGRQQQRLAVAEARLRPQAIALIEGEPVAIETDLDDEDARILAAILSRYARALRGEGTARIAAFFEGRDYLRRELEGLADRRAWRRAASAFALGDMGSPQAIPALTAALADDSREVRTAAARSLGQLRANGTAQLLVAALGSGSVPRAVAGQALIAIGPEAAGDLHPLLEDPDAAVRRAAAEVLGLIGGPAEAPVLAAAAEDPAAEVRSAALRALGQVGGRAESDVVRAALADRVPFVRTAAAHAAGRLGDRRAAPALIEQARADAYDPALAAAFALVRLDPPALLAAAESEDAGPYLGQAATRARLAA